MKQIISIFSIRREERRLACGALLYVVVLNAMVIGCYADQFMVLTDNYHKLFVDHFRVSGFDPLTYSVVSAWDTEYNIYRHPLLAYFMYVPYLLNRGLMALTGTNCVQLVVGVVLAFCTFYSFMLLYRILREVIGLRRTDGGLLAALTFSFAYVMLSSCVPDHFILSMFMLILTLYVAGRKLAGGRPFTVWQTVLLFVLTAGISLNNGIKVFLANLFVNGRRFWHPANLVLAVVLPAALMWGAATATWNHYEKPRFVARQEAKKKKAARDYAALYKQYSDTTTLKDTAAIRAAVDRLVKQRMIEKYRRDHSKPWFKHAGKPIAKGTFSQWTDISTPRLASVVENLFGESLMLHRDHLLGDTLRARPVIIHYRSPFNYVVEALVVLLFAAGVWCGRRQRFLWLALSFFGFDLLLHVILGFGINEVYIMGAHWLFVLPLAMGYALKASAERRSRLWVLRSLVVVLGLVMMCWNMVLFATHLFG